MTSEYFGKVLVVGICDLKLKNRFGWGVQWLDHWELFTIDKFPSGIQILCLPKALEETHQTRIRRFAEVRGVKRIEFVDSIEMLSYNLNQLFGNKQKQAVEERPIERTEGEIRVPTNRVRPFKNQPRTHFSKARLGELMKSIEAIGQQTPIIVKRIDGDPSYDYELVDGERRLRACTALKVPEMLVVIRVVPSEENQFMRSFVANFAREGHTPLDTARDIARMLKFPEFAQMERGAAVKEIASLAGKTQAWAYMYLRLLTLPDEIQRALEPDDNDRTALPLTMGSFLCTIESKELQLLVCKEVIKKNLSVAGAKHFARGLARKVGVKLSNSRNRNPGRDYKILLNYLKKTIEGAEILTSMPDRPIDTLFEHRDFAERKARLEEIDKAIRLLTKMRRGIDVRSLVEDSKGD